MEKWGWGVNGLCHTAAASSESNSCNFETICSKTWHLIQKHDINPRICVKKRQGEENEEGEEKKQCLFTITGSAKGMKTAETAQHTKVLGAD